MMNREQIAKLKKERYEVMVAGEKAIKAKKADLRLYIEKMNKVKNTEIDPCLNDLGVKHYKTIIANIQRSLRYARNKQHILVLAYCFVAGKRYSKIEKPGKEFSTHFMTMLNSHLGFHQFNKAIMVWHKTDLNIFQIIPNQELLWQKITLTEEAEKTKAYIQKTEDYISNMQKEREFFDTQEYEDQCIQDAIERELKTIEIRKAKKDSDIKKEVKRLARNKLDYDKTCAKISHIDEQLND